MNSAIAKLVHIKSSASLVLEFKELTDNRVPWDLIKYRIRQFTMKFSKEKAYRRRQKLTETSLKQAEEVLAAEPSESNVEKVEDLKMKYDSHFDSYSQRGNNPL